MGAGNPLIRSFDVDRYQPTTYFIDFTECYELDQWVKQELIDREDDRTFEDLSEDDKYNMLNSQLEFDVDEFRENYFLEKEFFGDKYSTVDQKDSYVQELSAAYMGGGVVIVESDNAYIVTTTEAEYHHYPIAIVPKFKFDELCEDVDYEQQHKYDWYQARDKDYDAMCQRLAEKLYEKKIKQFRKTHEPTMRKLHEHYAKQMSQRNGAWMSEPIKIIGKDFKFL